MGKSILHRLFGLGKLPKKMVPILEQEGIVLFDEGISGSICLRRFRAPGRIHSFKRAGFVGSVVLTQLRFAAFSFSRPVINVPRNDKRLSLLELSLPKDGLLCVKFNAGDFHDGWSGSVECRFHTPLAQRLVASIEQDLTR